MKIEDNKVVGIEYTLKDEKGVVMDSNKGQDLLYFIQGLGNIVPGLESAMTGKSKGDTFDVVVKAADGYGEHSEEKIRRIPRDVVKHLKNLEVGAMLQAQGPNGVEVVTITEMNDTEIVLNGNHPMAGHDLYFSVRVGEIRNATAEELEHGHAHDPNGHHHH